MLQFSPSPHTLTQRFALLVRMLPRRVLSHAPFQSSITASLASRHGRTLTVPMFGGGCSRSRRYSGTSKGRVLLLYSGGLDTSVILRWLVEEGFDVVGYMGNLGQAEDFEKAQAKGLTCGAERVHVDDIREDFVENFVFPHNRASVLYENTYLMGTSIARPCLVKNMMRVAKEEGCEFISHGATGKGNDQVRFELGAYGLNPDVKMIVPWRLKEFYDRFPGREELLSYAQEHGIPVEATSAKPYSMDDNLYHISYEGGILENPWNSPPADIFRMTTNPHDAPDEGEDIEIEFVEGRPVEVTNTSTGKTVTGSLDLFLYLNEVGSRHGIGRVDLVENRYVGIKSRGVYETPGGTILHKANVDLEGITLDREVRRVRDSLAVRYADLCYYGYWFSPEMRYVMSGIDLAQKTNTGRVRLHLYKGSVTVRGRKSPCTLYDEKLASFNMQGYNPGDAEGFIKTNAIRLKANHRRASAMLDQK